MSFTSNEYDSDTQSVSSWDFDFDSEAASICEPSDWYAYPSNAVETSSDSNLAHFSHDRSTSDVELPDNLSVPSATIPEDSSLFSDELVEPYTNAHGHITNNFDQLELVPLQSALRKLEDYTRSFRGRALWRRLRMARISMLAFKKDKVLEPVDPEDEGSTSKKGKGKRSRKGKKKGKKEEEENVKVCKLIGVHTNGTDNAQYSGLLSVNYWLGNVGWVNLL